MKRGREDSFRTLGMLLYPYLYDSRDNNDDCTHCRAGMKEWLKGDKDHCVPLEYSCEEFDSFERGMVKRQKYMNLECFHVECKGLVMHTREDDNPACCIHSTMYHNVVSCKVGNHATCECRKPLLINKLRIYTGIAPCTDCRPDFRSHVMERGFKYFIKVFNIGRLFYADPKEFKVELTLVHHVITITLLQERPQTKKLVFPPGSSHHIPKLMNVQMDNMTSNHWVPGNWTVVLRWLFGYDPEKKIYTKPYWPF